MERSDLDASRRGLRTGCSMEGSGNQDFRPHFCDARLVMKTCFLCTSVDQTVS